MDTCYYCTNPYTSGCSCIPQRLCDIHRRTHVKKIRVSTTELQKGFIDILPFLKLFKSQTLEYFRIWARPYSMLLKELTPIISELINTPIVSSSSIILSIAFNQISKIVATLNEKYEIILWDYSKNSKLKEINKCRMFSFEPNSVYYKSNIVLSMKYEYIACCNDFTLGIWFYNKNKVESKKLPGLSHLKNIKTNEEILTITDQFNRIKIFSAKTFEFIDEMNCGINGSLIEISECNKIYFCSKHHQKILKVFDMPKCYFSKEIDLKYNKTTCFTLSQDNHYIGLAYKNKIITVYILPDLTDFFEFKPHESQIETLTFISNPSRIVSGGQDHYLVIWDLQTRSCFKKIDLKVKCFHIQSFEDNQLMVLGYNNDIETININDGSVKSWLDGHLDEISSIALSKSLNFLATGGHDHSIYIWKINDQSFVSKKNAHQGCINCLSFFQNEESLASFGGDFFIRIWNRTTLEMIKFLKCENQFTQIFAADDSLVVGNEEGKKITFWQVYDDKIKDFDQNQSQENIFLVTENRQYMILIKMMFFIVWKLDLVD